MVIPNWNGRDLLAKYLPSVATALEGNPDNEIIVVDDGSTDGSAEFLSEHFPNVTVIALSKNVGFGRSSNAGFTAARNDIVVLLNSDMRVAENFLQPLLDGFTDEKVFAVSCQIFFSDPDKVRQETGLTQVWWDHGRVGARHRLDGKIQDVFPCFYAGGGSSAFDRRKFLELGGFDHLLKPFYLEDTDLGFLAWKRGWKVFYQPRSVVWHEHRGTIGRSHPPHYINNIVQKNFLLFLWKNLHEPSRLLLHFARTWADAFVSYCFGPSPERSSLSALCRAFLQLPQAMASRWRARRLAEVSDTETFRRPLGGYFHDRFHESSPEPAKLNVLFLSPYQICPPTHGGGVFMYATAKALASRTNLHVIALLDYDREREDHKELTARCVSADFLVRPETQGFSFGSILPFSVREVANHELEWMIHRTIYLHRIDVLQIEYTNLGQYAGDYGRIVNALFEHDVYFQSVGRRLKQITPALKRMSAGVEYLRALRFELQSLPRMDHIQVCSKENKDYLASFLPQLTERLDETLRAGIDTSRYTMQTGPREPFTMLFLGSFTHLPNQEALSWFVQSVLPRIVVRCPQAKLVVIGSNPPPRHSLPAADANVEIRGFVKDLDEPFTRYSVFVCPILSGSGVRVKLLEAFCMGIPVVSTRVGAEGLADRDGDLCMISDDPGGFADRVLQLFEQPGEARQMVARARHYVTTERDIVRMTDRLVAEYHRLVREKRGRVTAPAASSPNPS
ncbi:MAG TPA: glycosyltransferase [Bryobacteraceae bacterium]|nr:glycosyltransferase [Bryobacteraceae bacterium]